MNTTTIAAQRNILGSSSHFCLNGVCCISLGLNAQQAQPFLNPLKVCHTKIDRIRSMGVFPLNSVVCRRMATKLPMKLPNAFLYAKLKSFRGVHIQLLAEIDG